MLGLEAWGALQPQRRVLAHADHKRVIALAAFIAVGVITVIAVYVAIPRRAATVPFAIAKELLHRRTQQKGNCRRGGKVWYLNIAPLMS
jgi:hypothetical protein